MVPPASSMEGVPASHSLSLTGRINTGFFSAHSRDGKCSHIVVSVCPSLARVRLGVFICLSVTWISFSGKFCSFFYWIIGLSLFNPCLPPWSLPDLSPQTTWMPFPPSLPGSNPDFLSIVILSCDFNPILLSFHTGIAYVFGQNVSPGQKWASSCSKNAWHWACIRQAFDEYFAGVFFKKQIQLVNSCRKKNITFPTLHFSNY